MRYPSLTDAALQLKQKKEFLLRPDTYGQTSKVEVIETHMSIVFLTDDFVYKLKKPVSFDFLDFSTLEARKKYCYEEIFVNRPLGGDTYLSVVSINSFDGHFTLGGKGEPVDWLVKMKRLPALKMLHLAIVENRLDEASVHKAASRLAEFYAASEPLYPDPDRFRHDLIQDVEDDSSALLSDRFKLSKQAVLGIETDLLHFLIREKELFAERIERGRIVDAHGDLRPEHICLLEEPVIIDRIEFDPNLRVMDIAEELSFLAMECEVLGASAVGNVFFGVYGEVTHDRIPDKLVSFYKGRRAFLRAKLSVNHLLERRYLEEREKWLSRCESYLQAAVAYCREI